MVKQAHSASPTGVAISAASPHACWRECCMHLGHESGEPDEGGMAPERVSRPGNTCMHWSSKRWRQEVNEQARTA